MFFQASFLSFLLPILALSVPQKRTECIFDVFRVGKFQNHAVYVFDGSTLPKGLSANARATGGTPFDHVSDASLASVSDGFLNLKVPGGQSQRPIRGGIVVTDATNILYASVSAKIEFSSVPGTAQGMSHQSNYSEVTLEYTSGASPGAALNVEPTLHYTSVAVTRASADDEDPGSELQYYGIDWLPGTTRFSVGGIVQQEFNESVPRKGGQFSWENWSNGYAEYSSGPPLQDSIMRIRLIEMFWNATDGSDSCNGAGTGIGTD